MVARIAVPLGQLRAAAGHVGGDIKANLPTQSRRYSTLSVNEKLCKVTLTANTWALPEIGLVPFTVVTVTLWIPLLAKLLDSKAASILPYPVYEIEGNRRPLPSLWTAVALPRHDP
jgi:hypothetical protein